jgi:hypothetical protein
VIACTCARIRTGFVSQTQHNQFTSASTPSGTYLCFLFELNSILCSLKIVRGLATVRKGTAGL